MPTYTLSQLEALAYGRVDNNTALYGQAEVDAVINEAIRTLNLFTGFYQGSAQVPGFSVPGQRVYNTPSPILFPVRVQFEKVTLAPTSLHVLAKNHRDWAYHTTANYGPVQDWARVGISQFVIHPADAAGGQAMLVTGVQETPLLVQPGDTMVLDDEFVEIIEEYCAHRLPLKVGGKIFTDASLLYQSFLRKMKERRMVQGVKMPRYFVLTQQGLERRLEGVSAA